MTASAIPNTERRQRRIIERPRLTKLLDETDARTILLLAPAGYGKTTLARQWARSLSGAVSLTLTSAHVDVAWLAEDLAREVTRAGVEAERIVREHIHARSNPQAAERELGRVIAERLDAAHAQWLILDDYHAIAPSAEAEGLIAAIAESCAARLLV